MWLEKYSNESVLYKQHIREEQRRMDIRKPSVYLQWQI